MSTITQIADPERLRLERQGMKEKRTGGCGDRIWRNGPGGTVREDYSAHGEAWEHLAHDQARSPGLPLERGWLGRHLR
ncbi:MAG: hypothetical protein IPP10_16080 [Candidatus Competibacteraceae bacterium]|nr:hypothetical protein [Candidatus Competibacteraceae bacterium]